jgi:hypothetical protein
MALPRGLRRFVDSVDPDVHHGSCHLLACVALWHAARLPDVALLAAFAPSALRDLVRIFWLSRSGDSLVVARSRMSSDIDGFLNVGLSHTMQPGQLLHAYPPFCIKDTSVEISMRPLPATEVILVHARFAKEIAEIPDGEEIEIRPTD